MAGDHASASDARPQRLFVAASLPGHAMDAVEHAIAPWREALPQARWTPRRNWHVTLLFLGATHPRLIPWVHERLVEVGRSTPAVLTRVHGLGSFPSGRRARVLWAGLDDQDEAFAALVDSVKEALTPQFPPDARPFSPHLTVARCTPALDLPAVFSTTPLEGEPFVVSAIVLMRSHLRRPAPVYEPMGTFHLAGVG